MAGADRAETQHLSFLAEVADDVAGYGLFPVVRGAEGYAQKLPPVGRAKHPKDNVVDLAQKPSMGFPPATLASVERKGTRTKVKGYWLGLTGPMAPLPIHLTEFAFYEDMYASQTPFGDWLDVISGRMLQLFYRAWAEAQPAVLADRPKDDRFSRFLAALSGAAEGARARSSFPARARTHYAALFAGARSAVAIEDSLSHLLGQKVTLQEFQPRWRHFEREDLSRLGKSFATLGEDAVLGDRILSGADAIRIVIRAKTLRDYQSLLPTGTRFAIAAEALDAFTPGHIEWDICLEMPEDKIMPVRLDGRAQLGWSSWCLRQDKKHKAEKGSIRSDAHLRKLRHKTRQGKTL